jgi:hypothetical protein
MDWAAIEGLVIQAMAAIESWSADAAAWVAAHPPAVAGGIAVVMALATLACAAAAWRAAGRAAAQSDAAARSTAGIESALAALRRETRSDAAFDRQRALTQDALARLARLESAVEQLRAEIVDQQTAKYRINEAIRQAMER